MNFTAHPRKEFKVPLKVALIASSIVNRGGGERMILSHAQKFHANIFTGFYLPEQTFPEFKDLNVRVLDESRSFSKLRSLVRRWKLSRLRLKGFDVYIYHFTHAIPVALNHKNNVWYCHAPPRFLYDLYKTELNHVAWYQRQLFRLITARMRTQDQKAVKHMDIIVANSINTQERIKKFYGRDSVIVYPPVDVKKFLFKKFGDFYLSAGRLDKIKRVDLIVKAFQKMPDKKLVVASGGPELENIKVLARGFKNITVLGWTSDEKLRELMGSCRATLYMSENEDFGMTPVESMACGKPCIATDFGGMKETIVHKKTGLLIPGTVDDIINAVQWLTLERCKAMKTACQKQAKKFSEEEHVKGMKRILEKFKRKS